MSNQLTCGWYFLHTGHHAWVICSRHILCCTTCANVYCKGAGGLDPTIVMKSQQLHYQVESYISFFYSKPSIRYIYCMGNSSCSLVQTYRQRSRHQIGLRGNILGCSHLDHQAKWIPDPFCPSTIDTMLNVKTDRISVSVCMNKAYLPQLYPDTPDQTVNSLQGDS